MPLSPDFQDPPKAPNYPPSFVDSFPFFELQVTAPETFEVKVADPNPQDTLYVRWVSDYPRYTGASALLKTEEGVPLEMERGIPVPQASITYRTAAPNKPDGTPGVACLNFAPGQEHKLVVIVADRPFTAPEDAENRDYRFNEVSGGTWIMSSWSITCP